LLLVRFRSVAIPNPKCNQFVPAQNLICPRQSSEPSLHGCWIRVEHLLRDLRIHNMIARIIGKMEFERALLIDADSWKAQRKRASGPAFVQSDFPACGAVDRRLGLIIRDKPANILHDNNGGRHWRRLKITQSTHLYSYSARPNAKPGAF